MNDELETLKQLVKREQPILPRPEARRRAISDALSRFETLNNAPRQGLSLADRLKAAASAAYEALFRRRPMRLSLALAGSASLAVLALAVINTAQFENLRSRPVAPQQPSPSTAETPQISPPASSGRQDAELAVAAKPSTAQPLERKQAAEISPPAPYVANSDAQPSVAMDAATLPSMGLAAPSPAPPAMDALRGAGMSTAEPAQEETSFYRGRDNVSGEPDQVPHAYREHGRDRFTDIVPNPVRLAASEPVSTFSIDVDTASYAFLRASLNSNMLPQKDAVRIEELVNYFPYDYAGPVDRAQPFKASVSVFPTPWNPDTRLLHVGIKGFTLDGEDARRANLVFLIDTSGSMDEPNRLPLLRNALKMLVETLDAEDSVAIVAYAGSAGTVLEPTRASDKARILAAIDGLTSAGSTAGAEGIRQAYQLAERHFDRQGINRVILATDGDFNVGITDPEELKSFVERKRETGVFLSVLGFG
ncbi:MAG: von Willebrand factor type A domain-containing protein, partial [Pseudomonadota bacterium]|nr:von Willebrand factor type A domain-containing protein [Pseudomonadota bacterium]